MIICGREVSRRGRGRVGVKNGVEVNGSRWYWVFVFFYFILLFMIVFKGFV